jgi:energy-coupling factor transport system substrate-specific component
MSWPLASFLIVGVVLALGWLAYERRRQSARLVAVVGTLAAVAALGRDAFVALPEVKPITAMTLVVGYALGPLPGFTVGALGILMSNFLLGQGPYTPWQMAAWGCVGLFGAALARLSGRRLGRMPLALGCALAALAAKETMNVYTWTIGASHTPAALLAVAGTGLPFDLVDTVASLLFGLAFGPELARLLARTRARMDISWEPVPRDRAAPNPMPSNSASPNPLPLNSAPRGTAGGATSGALAILAFLSIPMALALGGAPARASATSSAGVSAISSAGVPATSSAGVSAISSAGVSATSSPGVPVLSPPRAHVASLSPELSFLTSAQNPDGGFGGARGQHSSELYTAWSAMGLAAAGRNPSSVRRGGRSLLDSLRAEASTLQGLGDAERTILAARACGASAYSFAGRALVAEVLLARARDNSFDHQVNLTAFAILALRAAGHSPGFRPIREAAGWIERQQGRDGGFGFGSLGSPSDVDDTGATLQALAAAGAHNTRALAAAADYLVRSQNPDGGYPQRYGGESNAQSTAWAVQGLIAAGRNPDTVRRRGSRSPRGYLESLLTPGGSIRYSRTSTQTPVWVTAQALIALAGKTFPVAP